MSNPSVKKNYLFNTLYEILAIITPLITTPHVSRILGADGIGTYSYTSSIMAYFTLFAALGTKHYGNRMIARCRSERSTLCKTFWEIELVTVLTSIVCLLLWLVLIAVSKEHRYMFIALIPVLFATMLDISWFYTGIEEIKYTIVVG